MPVEAGYWFDFGRGRSSDRPARKSVRPLFGMLTNRLTLERIDLEEVLASHLRARRIFEHTDNSPCRRVDHIARRRIRIAAVKAERNPSRLAGQFDRRER